MTVLDSGCEVATESVLAGARAALAGLMSTLWAAKRPDELLAVNAELERLRSTVAAVQAQVAVEIEASDAAKTASGWGSTGDYLTAASGGHRGRGPRMLRTGRVLCQERSATLRALAEGDISPEHAEVIAHAVRFLPADPAVRAAAEEVLLEQAAHRNASELRAVADRVLETVDPDGHARREEKKLRRDERSAHLARYLSLAEDGLGGIVVRGRGAAEDGAVLKAALQSLAAPDALQTKQTDPDEGLEGRDLRDHGARMWDALVGVARTALAAEVLPTSHGRRPRVVVTIDIDDLRRQAGAGVLETGERLSATAVRKLACAADVLPVVLGRDGQVVDVGRSARLVRGAVWDALVARDRHCRFPGCRRPPIACDGHHIVHWADGGGTDQANLVLLCGTHHTLIHSTLWQVRIGPQHGLPEFRPPPGRRLGRRLRHQTEPSDQTEPGYGERDGGWIRERPLRE